MPSTSRAALVALAACALVLSACAAGQEPAPVADPVAEAPQWSGAAYTALGDSYTTGAGLGTLQPGAEAESCRRTEANYPSRLAEALDMELTDRSCGSARSGDVLEPRGDRPAQIDDVTEDTDLVTLRVGANDGDLFDTFFSACTRVALDDPDGTPCQDQYGAEVPQTIAATGADVVQVLSAVRERAPRATVLLLGYSQLLSESGSCPDVPFSAGDVDWIAASEEALDATLEQAAELADARYVSMRELSEGQDLCAGSESWINNATPGPNAGAALHPNRSEVAAVIELLTQTLAEVERG